MLALAGVVLAEPAGFGRTVPVPGTAAARALQPAADPKGSVPKGSVLSSVAAYYRAHRPAPADDTPNPMDQPGVRAFEPAVDSEAGLADPPLALATSSSGPIYSPTTLASLPKAIILGAGKCGTNALAMALKNLGLKAPDNGWSDHEEKGRQGFAGEVNWPCKQWKDGLETYKQHFPQPSPKEHFDYYDKSSNLMGCAWNITNFVPPEVKLFAVLCDPLEAIWSRMNHDRASFGANVTNATLLINTVLTRFKNRGPGKQKDCLQLKALDPHFSLSACYQLESSLHYAWWTKSWGTAIETNRVKFLLAERSIENPLYFVREAAAHLGIDLPKDHENLGVVHSSSDDPTHLAPEGKQWDRFLSIGAPKLRKIVQELHDAIPELFGNQSAEKWWPWAKLPPGHKSKSWQDHARAKALPSLPVAKGAVGFERERSTCKSWCFNADSEKNQRANPVMKWAVEDAQAKLCENLDCGSCDFCKSRAVTKQESGEHESKPKSKSKPKAASPSPLPKAATKPKAAVKKKTHVASEPQPKAASLNGACKSINVMVNDAWCDTGCRASRATQAPGCETMCCCEDSCLDMVPMACKAGDPGCAGSK